MSAGAAGVLRSLLFSLAAAFGLGQRRAGIVPLLFLNAALYMLVRYLNVPLRLENDLRRLHGGTLWMQGRHNLFYPSLGFFTSNVLLFWRLRRS